MEIPETIISSSADELLEPKDILNSEDLKVFLRSCTDSEIFPEDAPSISTNQLTSSSWDDNATPDPFINLQRTNIWTLQNDPLQPFPELEKLEVRVETFRDKWSPLMMISAQEMAKNGFYFESYPDHVRCHKCWLGMSHLNPGCDIQMCHYYGSKQNSFGTPCPEVKTKFEEAAANEGVVWCNLDFSQLFFNNFDPRQTGGEKDDNSQQTQNPGAAENHTSNLSHGNEKQREEQVAGNSDSFNSTQQPSSSTSSLLEEREKDSYWQWCGGANAASRTIPGPVDVKEGEIPTLNNGFTTTTSSAAQLQREAWSIGAPHHPSEWWFATNLGSTRTGSGTDEATAGTGSGSSSTNIAAGTGRAAGLERLNHGQVNVDTWLQDRESSLQKEDTTLNVSEKTQTGGKFFYLLSFCSYLKDRV